MHHVSTHVVRKLKEVSTYILQNLQLVSIYGASTETRLDGSRLSETLHILLVAILVVAVLLLQLFKDHGHVC